MSDTEHVALQQRLDRLERGYLKWRRTAVAAIAGVVILLAYGTFASAQRPADNPRPGAEAGKFDPAQVAIDDNGMRTTYTNFFRATGNPDEVILDFGIYSQVTTTKGVEPIKLTERMVMNFVTTKKLQVVLKTVVDRHEAAFGEIQLDPEKRLRRPGGRE